MFSSKNDSAQSESQLQSNILIPAYYAFIGLAVFIIGLVLDFVSLPKGLAHWIISFLFLVFVFNILILHLCTKVFKLERKSFKRAVFYVGTTFGIALIYDFVALKFFPSFRFQNVSFLFVVAWYIFFVKLYGVSWLRGLAVIVVESLITVIISVLLVFVFVAGGLFTLGTFFQSFSSDEILSNVNLTEESVVEGSVAKETKVVREQNNYNVYTSEDYGFSFGYPKDWKINSENVFGVRLAPIDQTIKNIGADVEVKDESSSGVTWEESRLKSGNVPYTKDEFKVGNVVATRFVSETPNIWSYSHRYSTSVFIPYEGGYVGIHATYCNQGVNEEAPRNDCDMVGMENVVDTILQTIVTQ